MAVEINGDGLITVDGTTSTQGRVRLKEDADNGSNYVELTAPASVTANRTITFPDATGTVNTSGAVNEVPAGTVSAPSIYPTGDANTGIFFPAADTIAFAEGGAEAMRIDSSGNVGIGVTPSAWASTWKVLQNQGGFVGTNSTTGQLIASNSYSDGTNWRYVNTGAATQYAQTSGAHSWSIAASGTAGNTITFTQAMTLDASGNLGIGTTSPGQRLDVKSASGGCYLATSTASTANLIGYFGVNNSGQAVEIESNSTFPLRFITNGAERARITSGGQVLVGTTSSLSSDGRLQSSQSAQSSASISADATNGSFDYHTYATAATRSASSAYSFFNAWSGNYADVEFKLRGDGNGYADGTWNNNGADYAEFFESANGQALTLGATVVLDGNKVREATDQDPTSAIIGVVRPKEPSKASMVVGNTAWNKWANKYLTDDFDRYIMEDHDVVEWEEQVLERDAVAAVEAVVDEEGNEVSPAIPAQEAVYKTKQHSYESHNIPAGVTVPADAVRKTHDDKGNKFQHYKLNPAWDKDAEYVNRENRPEWNIIGLLGQVKILKGQPVGDRWIKMRDVSSTVEEWMIR